MKAVCGTLLQAQNLIINKREVELLDTGSLIPLPFLWGLMLDHLLFIINLNDLGMNLLEQFKSWFDPERSEFIETLRPYFVKALKNPLATAITLLALFGIPFTLIKINKTSTEAGKRLDKLIEELDQYEENKPQLNFRKKIKNASSQQPQSPESDEASSEPGQSCNREPAGENDLITQALGLTQEKPGTGPLLKLPSLYSPDTPEEEQTKNPPFGESEEWIEPSIAMVSQEDPSATIEDAEPDWNAVAGDDFQNSESDLPLSSKYAEENLADLEIQDLQKEMEKTIEKLTHELSIPNPAENAIAEESETGPVASGFDSIEPFSFEEEVTADSEPEERFQEPLAQTLSSEPASDESPWNEEETIKSRKRDSIITQLKTFQKNLETRLRFDPQDDEPDFRESESAMPASREPTLKSTGIFFPGREKAKGKNYQELLESLILLKNPNKR